MLSSVPDTKSERMQGPAKGLRHFSLRVCKKVEEKGITTYNEVADELVLDMGGEIGGDQKNIRRRVYDALNVLMAMNIINKDKKEISWIGLPNNLIHDYDGLQGEKKAMEERLVQKRKHLQELITRQTAMKNLIQRNKMNEDSMLATSSIKGQPPTLPSPQDILHLPFILINAPKDCRINCEMLEDRSHYFFEFDAPFLIHEDIEILRMMGLCEPQPTLNTTANGQQPHPQFQQHLQMPQSPWFN